jgi:hypothetical protein
LSQLYDEFRRYSCIVDNSASLSFIRLLANLRWLAVIGQALTVLIVTGPLQWHCRKRRFGPASER